MFKHLTACFALILCAFTGCEKSNELTVGTSADYKPFMFYENGELKGFEKDLVDAVCARLNKKPVYKDLSFDSIIGALQSGRIHVAVAAITPTEDRVKNVDFSEPYHKAQFVLLVSETSSIKGIGDLANANVGVQMGTTYENKAKGDWLKTQAVKDVVSRAKIPELIQEYKTGRVDALLMGEREAKEVAAEQGNMRIIVLEGLDDSAAFALPKNSNYAAALDKVIADMEKDGSLKQIREKWGL